MDARLLDHILHRSPEANKYDFGHMLVFGGSAGMVGAPLLSGKGALRIGAGLVTIATDIKNKSVYKNMAVAIDVTGTKQPKSYREAAAGLRTLAEVHPLS